MTIEEMLREAGAGEEEIKTLTANPKITAAITKQLAERDEATARANKAQTDLDAYNKWYKDEANPAYEKALRDATEARSKQAASDARLKALQDYGLAQVDDPGAAAVAPPAAAAAFDASKYVPREEFTAVADRFGEAIAQAQDITNEYYRLMGSPIPDSFETLRKEAIAKRQSVREYAESKYNFAAKRTERDAATKLEYENKIRADERTKMASQYGNPDTRPLVPSSSPFTRRPDGSASAAPGSAPSQSQQPWEKNDASQDRVSKVVAKVLQ